MADHFASRETRAGTSAAPRPETFASRETRAGTSAAPRPETLASRETRAGTSGLDSSAPRPVALRGGTVFDGLGAPGLVADVLVADGVVQQVGSIDVPVGARVVDCSGMFVAPGFIDAHSHSDVVPFMDESHPFKLHQGVTTEINGNCGFSVAPTSPASAEVLSAGPHEVVGGVEVHPASFAEFLDRAERVGPANNMAYLVGHGTLRLTANGSADALRPGALDEMMRLLDESLAAGAVGFSTGLIYPPGCYADAHELHALARVASHHGAVYATHMRDEARHVLDAIDEAVGVARAGGLRLQISHCKVTGRENHGRATQLLERIQAARLAGVDALGDQYPYTAAATGLAALLPNAAAVGGDAQLVDRLRDPAQRAALRAQAQRGGAGDGVWAQSTPDGILVVSHTDPAVVGRTLADIAGGDDAFEVVCQLIARDPAAGMVIEAMAEPDVREIMSSPLIGVGSDNAVPSPGLVHPRSLGTFPRLLSRYVRELGVLSWPEAIRKATSLIALHFGLRGRGTLLVGSHADVVVFDPETVGHAGTYTDPYVAVTGVHTVLLGGHEVIADGRFTGQRLGRILRRQATT